ncbi:hypothetical protein QQF64_003112 [Cirrhinus molitorella]|uniref:Uncharacterized protein n=1 Tax=Cirrhinus molitorella TaxID=172907 RepID=A0ABR3MJ27_9TELE
MKKRDVLEVFGLFIMFHDVAPLTSFRPRWSSCACEQKSDVVEKQWRSNCCTKHTFDWTERRKRIIKKKKELFGLCRVSWRLSGLIFNGGLSEVLKASVLKR